MFAGMARVLMAAHVIPRPAVVAAGLHVRDVVGNAIVAERVAFVNRAPRLAGFRADGKADAVANAVSEDALAGTVRIKLEDIGAILFVGSGVRIIDVGCRADGDKHLLAVGRELNIAGPVAFAGGKIGDFFSWAARFQVANAIGKADDG